MKHYGDITKISGYDVPIVDICVGGSPCQDLSVAGLRKGLAGERSGLFMEQVRIIKEMREKERKDGKANVDIRPRFMVWENVPGAFSSNKGEDFRAVLEETAKIADENAVIPGLAKGQKWTPSGCIMGDGWSIAWRIHDAQFWGVPQRRKRIALIADFGGSSAPEILFERKGMPRNIAEGKAEGENIARTAPNSIGGAKCYGIGSFESNAMKSSNPNSGIYETEVSRTLDNHGGNPACNQGGIAIVDTYDVRISKEGTKNWRAHCYPTTISRCLDTQGENPDTNHGGVVIVECFSNVAACRGAADGTKGVHSQMLSAPEENFIVETKTPVYGFPLGFRPENTKCYEETATTLCNGTRPGFTNGVVYGENGFGSYSESVTPLKASGGNYGGAGVNLVVEKEEPILLESNQNHATIHPMVNKKETVRRLTPLECERLQGFPDGWTDIGDWVDSKGKKHKGDADAPRYTALGNSIALPFWRWMAKRMCAYFEKPTMASLFDGIGGFPLVYMEAGCEPIWASEIEEFPIAVTKLRFGED